jgi:hypothetical protein
METPTHKMVNGELVELTPDERDAIIEQWNNATPPPLPPAESYQVEAWMIRGGLDPDIVTQIIARVVPEVVQQGQINRKEALSRWRKASRVPRDFPLVNVIGAQMNLTPEQIDAAWPDILAL